MAALLEPSPADVAGAQAYARLPVPGLFLPSTRHAVALAAPRPGERLLDVALYRRLRAVSPPARIHHDAETLACAFLQASGVATPMLDSRTAG